MQEELIQDFKNGNKRAGDDFYNANKGLIYLAVNRYKLDIIEPEELMALVNGAFARAMLKFDNRACFSTYFMQLARGDVLMYCRELANMIRPNRKDFEKHKLTHYCDSLNLVIQRSDTDDICIKDTLGNVDDYTMVEINEVINKINKKDRQAFRLYYLDQYSQSEIAEKLNSSQVAISRSLKRGREIILKEVS